MDLETFRETCTTTVKHLNKLRFKRRYVNFLNALLPRLPLPPKPAQEELPKHSTSNQTKDPKEKSSKTLIEGWIKVIEEIAQSAEQDSVAPDEDDMEVEESVVSSLAPRALEKMQIIPSEERMRLRNQLSRNIEKKQTKSSKNSVKSKPYDTPADKAGNRQ